VNLDEAVALGAAIYAGLRADQRSLKPMQREKLSNVSVVDVANHYYGTIAMHQDEELNTEDLRVSIIIPKNTQIPCSKAETFYTRVEGQQFVRCRVTQSGDQESDPDFVNIILDEQLGPLPPGRPPQLPIEISYSYDLNQTMHVKFRDVKSGKTYEKTLELVDKFVSGTSVPDFRID
jgi:molecular chaperone DnaK